MVVNIGSLQDAAKGPGFPPTLDFKAFQLLVAIVFAVTGVSRASTVVTDIQDGYFRAAVHDTHPPAGAIAGADGGRLRAGGQLIHPGDPAGVRPRSPFRERATRSPAVHLDGGRLGPGLHRVPSWLSAIATYNPVTYLLEALRSLIFVGWDGTELLKGVAAIATVGVVSFGLCLLAFRGRIHSGS